MYLVSDNRDTLVGMRLAGIKGQVVGSAEEAEKLIDTLVKDKDIGIILVTEKLSKDMKEKINQMKQRLATPLIVEIPDRHGTIKDADYITGYVRESVGIKI